MPLSFDKGQARQSVSLFEDNIRLKADDSDDEVKVVTTSLIPFAYDSLIKSVLTWGYRPNIDFWIFPYDWQQSNRISRAICWRGS